MLSKHQPQIAITLGDPAGIGGEVILKALAKLELEELEKITIIGSQKLLMQTYDTLSESVRKTDLIHPEKLKILEVESVQVYESAVELGQENAATGAISFAYLENAIARSLAGEFAAIVTAPIAKSAWQAAGYNYPGQTELLAEKSGCQRVGMLFVARSPHTGWTLRALLATTHIPLQAVPQTLTKELMTQKLDLLVECLQQDFGIEHPHIAIAGLNPHSGEKGHLGTEEIEWLIPWLETAQQKYPQLRLDGPVPPDTMWVNPGLAWFGTRVNLENIPDAYLALYHDQGLIPVKLMAFDRAVNTSIGLPFIRTSPDHGTAFNIAGKGVADATSMGAAIELAQILARQRANIRN
ncbi:4-hydroxythreonine-4-phosphate dehydrogenase PdxA [Calothrix sp. NIES-3974]|uniref:4-hydroxythreonine-4-phosphate dehydrogenase PdxA n=1 Tax=Calothrix sp. NIES-3974 TaxID=2005462 RepID=UPI000B5F4CD3|nr:4-hydroxythreonine-4-phosphate dehydrogenase PdxA [Calothrix sp. NIES-3974]BAZ07491.1 4-hydroxythreonine-4-phosphate dehydrogenase [Calothrix sp. NIES-3974]